MRKPPFNKRDAHSYGNNQRTVRRNYYPSDGETPNNQKNDDGQNDDGGNDSPVVRDADSHNVHQHQNDKEADNGNSYRNENEGDNNKPQYDKPYNPNYQPRNYNNQGGGYNNQGGGGYNRNYNNQGGGYNREGGYNQGGGYNNNQGGGYKKPYTPNSYNNQGGDNSYPKKRYDQGGGYNNPNSYTRGEGGFNRENSYNRESNYNREISVNKEVEKEVDDTTVTPENDGQNFNRGGNNYTRTYNREGGSYNRSNTNNNNTGSYNRTPYNREGGNTYNKEGGNSYNREGGNNTGGYNRTPYNREGGNTYNNNRTPYNKEGGNSYNREGGNNQGGGYNRTPYNREGGNNQGGGYNRTPYNREGGNNQGGGGYNRNQGGGGFNQGGGGYNRNQGGGGFNQGGGGYNRNQGGGGFNQGGGGYNRNQGGGGFNQGGGGYNRNQGGGGFNQGGGGYNRNQGGGGFNQGGNSRFGQQNNSMQQRRKRIVPYNMPPTQVAPLEELPAVPFEQLDEVRLNRFIAKCGICARRDADDLIKAGRVKVNGEVVDQLGVKVRPHEDIIECNGKVLKVEKRVYVLYNKPKHVICAVDDQGRETVVSAIQRETKENIFPVGRLERDTTGLIILTNDTDLTDKLTDPDYGVRKHYHVTLNRVITEEDREALKAGVVLEDGFANVDKIEFITGKTPNIVMVEVHESRYRLVEKLFNAIGARVEELDRVMFATLTKKALPRGHWRYLSDREIGFLKMLPTSTGSKQPILEQDEQEIEGEADLDTSFDIDY